MAIVWYIPVMAINGVLEAFVSSASTPRDVADQAKYVVLISKSYIYSLLTDFRLLRWMTYTSFGYITCTIAVFQSGLFNDYVIVYLNMINLMVRIVYATRFIREFQRRNSYPYRPIVTPPPPLVFGVTILTGAFLMLSYREWGIQKYLSLPKSELLTTKAVWVHLGTGIMGLAVFFITW